MTAETLHAILLRRIRFSDTSLIVSWFSQERGKLKTVAKGALRANSSFAGKLDLFFQCELTVGWSQRSELHSLRETVLIKSFAGIRRNYPNTLAAGYFSELVEEKPATARAVHFFEHELAKNLGLESRTPGQAADHLLHSLQRSRATRAKLLIVLNQ